MKVGLKETMSVIRLAATLLRVITLTFIFPEKKRVHQMIKSHGTLYSLRVIWASSIQILFYFLLCISLSNNYDKVTKNTQGHSQLTRLIKFADAILFITIAKQYSIADFFELYFSSHPFSSVMSISIKIQPVSSSITF